jgi:hypothetical protein
MDMSIGLIVVGVALLVVVAVVIGLAQREERIARDRTWREIAHERRELWEERRRLEALVAELAMCRGCPLRPPEGQRVSGQRPG